MRRFGIILLAAAAVFAAAACKDGAASRNNLIPSGPESPTASVKTSAPSGPRYVLYEANPRCFASSRQLNAITMRLPQIKALGADVLWIMPFYPLGTEKAFGSPYCIKDYKGIRTECGTLDDFSVLVSNAHSKGMKVMLDWVANHTAWDHPWITEHPDWYAQDGQGNIVYPETWTDVAQLNYANNDLRAAMIDAMSFWVGKGVDGFRCDYAHGVPDSFWTEAITALRQINPDLVMLAESDYERLYDDGFDIVFSRALKAGLVDLFAERSKPSAFMIGSFSQTVSRVPEGKSKLFFITNHDDASEVSPVVQFPGEKAALSAFVLAAALDGSPLIYSSQEIGYPSKVNFVNVTVMDWASNTSYTGEYEAAMSVLSLLDRSRGFTSYVSDSTVWIVYDNGLVAVNTTGREVTCAYPSGFSERDESLTFGPYGYFVVFK